MQVPEAHPVLALLLGSLGSADDPDLWRLALGEVLEDLERTPDVRGLLLTVARVSGRAAGPHPEEQASLRLSWSRRAAGDWACEGVSPRFRRRRGHYAVTVLVPGGTRRLAFAEVTLVWHPVFPWAPPTETEPGRRIHAFARKGSGDWRSRGSRDAP